MKNLQLITVLNNLPEVGFPAKLLAVKNFRVETKTFWKKNIDELSKLSFFQNFDEKDLRPQILVCERLLYFPSPSLSRKKHSILYWTI